MKALLENEIISLYTENVCSDFSQLMQSVVTADATEKARIENEIVAAGMKFVPELIQHIQHAKGVTRGVCAMSLIRIGESCAILIKEAAKMNRDFAWAARYILSEINA